MGRRHSMGMEWRYGSRSSEHNKGQSSDTLTTSKVLAFSSTPTRMSGRALSFLLSWPWLATARHLTRKRQTAKIKSWLLARYERSVVSHPACSNHNTGKRSPRRKRTHQGPPYLLSRQVPEARPAIQERGFLDQLFRSWRGQIALCILSRLQC